MDIELVEITRENLFLVKEIYDYYILNTTVTFHIHPLSLEELESMLPFNDPKYKSFLIVVGKQTAGYCYISPYNKRPAYNRTAEVTIYIKHDFTSKGVGTAVISKLEPLAKDSGISVLIGIISAENHPSIRFFEKSGYTRCAHFREVGEKFGRVLDVVAYQKIIKQV